MLVFVGGHRSDVAGGTDRTAATVIFLAIQVHTEQQPMGACQYGEGQGVIQAGAVKAPLVIDQAAAGKGQLLTEVPLADKGAGIEQPIGEGFIAVMQPETLLVDLLAGIQPGSKGAGLSPVLVSLLSGQPPGSRATGVSMAVRKSVIERVSARSQPAWPVNWYLRTSLCSRKPR